MKLWSRNPFTVVAHFGFLLQGDESHAYLDQQLCCQHRRWVVCAPCLHWPDISRSCAHGWLTSCLECWCLVVGSQSHWFGNRLLAHVTAPYICHMSYIHIYTICIRCIAYMLHPFRTAWTLRVDMAKKGNTKLKVTDESRIPWCVSLSKSCNAGCWSWRVDIQLERAIWLEMEWMNCVG